MLVHCKMKIMNQNAFKKSLAFKMGMPRNGFNSSKSVSPVIIQDALAETANSRNLLFFGSRQSVMDISILIKKAFALNSFIAANLCSSVKYFSNFDLAKTSINSSNVALEYTSIPVLNAVLYACLFLEPAKIYALIRELVSKTKVLVISFQQIFKDFFCQSFFLCFVAQRIKKTHVFTCSSVINHFFQCNGYRFIKKTFSFRTEFAECYRCRFIHFNHNPFHNFSFLFFSKIQKINP